MLAVFRILIRIRVSDLENIKHANYVESLTMSPLRTYLLQTLSAHGNNADAKCDVCASAFLNIPYHFVWIRRPDR
jgi:hypothetical protein